MRNFFFLNIKPKEEASFQDYTKYTLLVRWTKSCTSELHEKNHEIYMYIYFYNQATCKDLSFSFLKTSIKINLLFLVHDLAPYVSSFLNNKGRLFDSI